MKKILSLLALSLGIVPSTSGVISCNSSDPKNGGDKSDNGKDKIEVTNNIKSLDLSAVTKTQNIAIKSYPTMLKKGYVFSVTGKNFQSFNKDKDPFTVSKITTSGVTTVEMKGFGTGTLSITAKNGSKVLTYDIAIKCVPAIELLSYNGNKNEDNFPSSLEILGGENGFPTAINNNKNKPIAFSFANIKDLIALGYDIKYSFVQTYSHQENILTGADGSTEPITGTLTQEGDKYFTKDSNNNIVFNANGDKIKSAGEGTFTFTATLNTSDTSGVGKKTEETFNKIFNGSEYTTIKSSGVLVQAFGYSKLNFKDGENTLTPETASMPTSYTNGDSFYNIKDLDAGKKDYKVTLDTGKTKTVGNTATIALLIPTDYFKDPIQKEIGLSASKATLANNDTTNITVYYIGKDKISVKDKNDSTNTNFSFDESTNKLSISKPGTYTVSAGGLTTDVTITLGEKTQQSDPVAPIVDLKDKESSVSTKDIASQQNWSLQNATYVNLAVLSSFMDNSKQFYAFYAQSTDLSFTISTNVEKSAKFLGAVLSGKFDMKVLLQTQGGDDSSSSSVYNEFIDSLSSLYFGQLEKKNSN
ncbi:hypothetical protein [Spiroplasma endosymbiont of Aspidapion aeneum]|uniref:hypothetical protein n=1 Tax=Spiroplasma endosymbiont of Aspidapion aeneum TaxID=3066276 RepID=UPI00313DE8D7